MSGVHDRNRLTFRLAHVLQGEADGLLAIIALVILILGALYFATQGH